MTSVLLSLSGTVLCCVVCDVCVAVTSVLLSLSDTMIVVVCDVCVAVIVRHSFVLCCV